jgi:hypothetical protein
MEKIVSLLYKKEKAEPDIRKQSPNEQSIDLHASLQTYERNWRANDHTSLNHTFVTCPEIFDFHCEATMTLQIHTE